MDPLIRVAVRFALGFATGYLGRKVWDNRAYIYGTDDAPASVERHAHIAPPPFSPRWNSDSNFSCMKEEIVSEVTAGVKGQIEKWRRAGIILGVGGPLLTLALFVVDKVCL